MDQRVQKRITQRVIDWRYVKFNLETREGQQGYRAYIQTNCKDASQVANDLFQHERSQVIEASQYWIAETIVRKVFGLPTHETFVKRNSLGQPKPESVELFI